MLHGMFLKKENQQRFTPKKKIALAKAFNSKLEKQQWSLSAFDSVTKLEVKKAKIKNIRGDWRTREKFIKPFESSINEKTFNFSKKAQFIRSTIQYFIKRRPRNCHAKESPKLWRCLLFRLYRYNWQKIIK